MSSPQRSVCARFTRAVASYRIWPRGTNSALLEAQLGHHVAEPHVVARDELAEFVGGEEGGGEADRLAGGRESRRLDRATHRVFEARDHRARRSLGRRDAAPRSEEHTPE